jgi:DNA-binding PadR family transcriptional regulator
VHDVLETAILGLLMDSDLHGYELKKRLTELFGTWSSVSFGSLYPALARLERSGYVRTVEASVAAAPMSGSLGAEVAAYRARARQSPTGRRARKVYGVTDAGRARLTTLLDDHTGDDRSFAVRVAFCRHLPGDARLALFRRRRSHLGVRLRAESAPAEPRSDLYRRSLVEFQRERLVREHEWLDRLIDAELDTPSPSSTVH